MRKVKVSFVIVFFDRFSVLKKTLLNLRDHISKYHFEVILVNNGELDIQKGIQKILPKAKYIKSPGNIGYGAGNNLGVRISKGEYVFVLNPDTRLEAGTLDELVSFLDTNKKAAIVAPYILYPSKQPYEFQGSRLLTPIRGIVAHSFINKLFPNNPISKSYYLKDTNHTGVLKVDTVPGCALLIRKKVFQEIGEYDENMFLYYEESDLGKRLYGRWDSYMILKAQVVHDHYFDRNNILRKINMQSRFYYFKKHYGLLSALFVEMFTRFSKWILSFAGILVLTSLLRFYRLEENIIFNGELGHNYLAIKNFVESGQIPLLGPPTSHEWLSFGPLFYWIFAPILVLSHYNPISGAYFFATLGVLLVILSYFYVSKLFNKTTGSITAFFIAISPLFLQFTRDSRFFSIILLLVFPFYYYLFRSLADKKYIFYSLFLFGIMFNFHLSPLIFIPMILYVVYTQRRSLNVKDYLKAGMLFLLPNIPFLLHNAMNGFAMLKNLLLWVPYRVLGFVGLYPKNTASKEIVGENMLSLYDVITKSFYPESIVIFSIVIAFMLYAVFFRLKHIKKHPYIFLSTLFLISYVGIFLHGNPPMHYYLPIIPIPIIVFSFLLEKLSHIRYGKVIVIGLLGVVFLQISSYLNNSQWYFLPQDRQIGEYVPYKLQQEIVQIIANDTESNSYQLHRVGPNDQFEGDYAQNYQYLLWLYGNEPINTSTRTYTIYEDRDKLNLDGKDVKMIGTIAITKESNQ